MYRKEIVTTMSRDYFVYTHRNPLPGIFRVAAVFSAPLGPFNLDAFTASAFLVPRIAGCFFAAPFFGGALAASSSPSLSFFASE